MEFDLIQRIRERTAQARDDVRLGIGDDAALLNVPAGHELVMAIDTLVAGVHFPVETAPADVGWKALAVNLSDLAAMGASPAWAMLALTLPQIDSVFVDGFIEGFCDLARLHQLALVGGDTTRGPLTISVAIHGVVPVGDALLRRGAQVGDAVLVTGTLGDAAAGLRCVQSGVRGADDASRASLMARLNRPTPRLDAGRLLRRRATACIDISDGLLADLGHICTASDVGAELDVSLLPYSSALRSYANDAAACQFALSGGDDYELCFTVPQAQVGAVIAALAQVNCRATLIGRIVEGRDVRVRAADGAWLNATSKGWDHFAHD